MAFVGPHHGPKILGKNHQSTTKVTLNEPPMTRSNNIDSFYTHLGVMYLHIMSSIKI